jgi:hypothetical protein
MTFNERQKTGGVYSKRQALRYKHVVVCCQHLTAGTVMNFLTEFYAHRKYQVSVSLFYFTVVSPLNRGHLLWKHKFVIHYKQR